MKKALVFVLAIAMIVATMLPVAAVAEGVTSYAALGQVLAK